MGAYRSQPDKSKTSTFQSHPTISFASSHMCGWRLYMQDASIAEVDFDGFGNSVFGIFDGHGGAEVAKFVQDRFIQVLKMNKHYRLMHFQRALTQTFIELDEKLKSHSGLDQLKHIQQKLILQDNLPKRDLKQCAGCTVLVCLLTERTLYIANAGDSQAYAKKNNKFISLNTIHDPLMPKEKQRIQKAGGFITEEGRINGCLNVSRALGDFDFKANRKLPFNQQMVICVPNLTIQSLQGIDYILMGCDGIWEEKQPQEIEEFIDKRMKSGGKLDKILEQLFEWLICEEQDFGEKQLGKDNMSAILIKFSKDNLKPTYTV